MFGILNSSQIYGLQHTHEKSIAVNAPSTQKTRRNGSDSGGDGIVVGVGVGVDDGDGNSDVNEQLFGSPAAGMKSPTNFIEKFIKSELFNGYDSIRSYKNFHPSKQALGSGSSHATGVISSLSCLHGSYRSSVESEFYEAVNLVAGAKIATSNCNGNGNRITDRKDKRSDNAERPDMAAGKCYKAAALQKSSLCQKLSDTELEMSQQPILPLVESSGSSSGEFNSDSTTATAETATPSSINLTNTNNSNNNNNNRHRQLPIPLKAFKRNDVANGNTNEITSDNSSSSLSTTTNSLTSSSFQTSSKSNDLQRSSSSASSGIVGVAAIATNVMRERKKANSLIVHRTSPETPLASGTSTATSVANDRSQRRKLMQLITSYDQQNKQLQRELARERRRRSEELTCVIKSLLCFESKLRVDMKAVQQRLRQRDAEICRLVRSNRMLQTQLQALDNAKDEGVEEVAIAEEDGNERKQNTQIDIVRRYDDCGGASSLESATADCLVSEALQCFSCQKQFYDIELKDNWSQTDGGDCRNTDEHTTEHGSSSDDTHSSSFYGARRSIRYTSKRTCGTFRDYMRSRSMHIDDDNDDNASGGGGGGNGDIGSNSGDCNGDGSNGIANDNEMRPYDTFEEDMSAISRDDSQHNYEKMNVYSRTIDRMHGVKSVAELRPLSRSSTKSSSSSSKISDCSATAFQFEEDDGIFLPTQDEDFDEEDAKESATTVSMMRTETLTRSEPDASPLLGAQANGSSGQCGHIIVVENRSTEFSEASPKQIYETSTDDWYASVSDQEEAPAALKPYGHNAVNPVLECVNQILLQQEMEEPLHGGSARTLSARNVNECETIVEMIATPMQLPSKVSGLTSADTAAMLPRRSSLSGRLSSRSNSQSSDGQPAARIGTLATRKRVHFSTKNSLVHVPRNDDVVDESNGDDVDVVELMPALSPQLLQCHPLQYFSAQLRLATQSPQSISATPSTATPTTVIYASQQREDSERLDTLNYESIYSNEYEPIGSENNSSSLYVDMESTAKSTDLRSDAKLHKMPPALPPKPANLLKFKKSLQQLDEVPDEHLVQEDGAESVATTFEPDYCSISEVNVTGIRNVQIVADVHKAPDSEPDADLTQTDDARNCDVDIEVSTVASVHSDDTCDDSHKTDDIEEILADIPKLPNVAAIIAPRNACKYRHQVHLDQQPTTDHYLLMSSKTDLTSPKAVPGECILAPAPSTINATGDLLLASPRSPKMCAKTMAVTPITLSLPLSLISNGVSGSSGNVVGPSSRTYGQKYLPNILAEINNRMHSFPTSNAPITPSKGAPQSLPKTVSPFNVTETEAALTASLPLLQAEFDWYNLDAEYGKASFHSASASLSIQHTPDILKVSENLSSVVVLEEIHEDHESIVAAADEYNLDEEFSLQDKEQDQDQQQVNEGAKMKGDVIPTTSDAAIFSPYYETPTLVSPTKGTKKKIKRNLANFEKFIEGSGLSTKALPNKRKIYFSGPFV